MQIDSCEQRHADGKLVMFLAIERVSNFTDVEFHDSAGRMEGSTFLRNVVLAFPGGSPTLLTDNGMAFANPPRNRTGPSRRFLGPHLFDRVRIEHEIEHRLTKPYHPWTKGQAERMNRTIRDATVKIFHDHYLDSLEDACPGLHQGLHRRKAPQSAALENTVPDGAGRKGPRQRRHPAADRGDGGCPPHPAKVQAAVEAVPHPVLHRGRNAGERMFVRLKDFRRVATRYGRRAIHDPAAVCIAAPLSDRP